MRSFAGGGSDFSSTSDAARCFEVGLGEQTTSLAWLPKQTSCLVAGIGKSYLRIYDIRGQSGSYIVLIPILATILFPFHFLIIPIITSHSCSRTGPAQLDGPSSGCFPAQGHMWDMCRPNGTSDHCFIRGRYHSPLTPHLTHTHTIHTHSHRLPPYTYGTQDTLLNQ